MQRAEENGQEHEETRLPETRRFEAASARRGARDDPRPFTTSDVVS